MVPSTVAELRFSKVSADRAPAFSPAQIHVDDVAVAGATSAPSLKGTEGGSAVGAPPASTARPANAIATAPMARTRP